MDAITKILARTPHDAEYDSFMEELDAAGYRIVPKEPTEEQIAAGWIDKEDVNPDEIYRAMLDAAPSPVRFPADR